ncbi:MAG: hypothetical protein ACI841_002969 [Planctomycetota bacterium]|jgi:hypothetical protein
MPSRTITHIVFALFPFLFALSCAAERSSVPNSVEGTSVNKFGVEPPEPAREIKAWPWTETFMKKSALVADYVTIRGPKGLLDHAVVQQDPDHFEFKAEATSAGFRQVTSIRRDVDIYDPIRAQLDALQIMVLREIVVLERPGPVSVEIDARGSVYYHDLATGHEQRTDQLELVGAVEHE